MWFVLILMEETFLVQSFVVSFYTLSVSRLLNILLNHLSFCLVLVFFRPVTLKPRERNVFSLWKTCNWTRLEKCRIRLWTPSPALCSQSKVCQESTLFCCFPPFVVCCKLLHLSVLETEVLQNQYGKNSHRCVLLLWITDELFAPPRDRNGLCWPTEGRFCAWKETG